MSWNKDFTIIITCAVNFDILMHCNVFLKISQNFLDLDQNSNKNIAKHLEYTVNASKFYEMS